MRFSLLFATFLLVGVFGLVRFEPQYDLSVQRNPLLSAEQTIHAGKKITVPLIKKQNIVYIGVKNITFSDADTLCLTVYEGSNNQKQECLDRDGEQKGNELFTFPLALSQPTDHISISIESQQDITAKNITLYSMNTAPVGKKLVFKVPSLTADTTVVSRSDWGADETMRYVDSPYWKEKYPAYLDYVKRPKTQAELAEIALDDQRTDFLKKNFGETAQVTSIRRYENGHELLWPIEKVKKVDKIILHHTAESLDKAASDEELLRAIYVYHTLSRQWGDIGYNFIIGQRGKIYEGRAGGDYVVGAHASYNNMGSVGIATLGNFENLTLNRDQKAGLEEAITMVSRKYGITLSAMTDAVRLCNTATCSPLQKIRVSSLLGHRDVGTTSCPGTDIYTRIGDFTQTLGTIRAPILNLEKQYIDPVPPYRVVNLTPIAGTLTPSNPPAQVGPKIPVRYVGQRFRLKLSYPRTDLIALSSYTNNGASLLIDRKRYIVSARTTLSVGIVGNNLLEVNIDGKMYTGSMVQFSSSVVRIDSWERIPAWDKKGTYNDNLFRDRIVLRNLAGSLLVTNELPLEWYLKGLGEVSNTDPLEKIKTITVAARTYARYYMDANNRKYDTNLYDGSDDPDSFQKYLGYSYELRSPIVARMVDATRGKMIYFEGKIIKPWYFSASDGSTRSYKEYCESNNGINCEDIAYLQSVSDPAGAGKQRLGHGVGISGVGATYFANLGKSYTEIIQYYLKGVEIKRK